MQPCLTWITWVGKVIRARKSKVGEIHTYIDIYLEFDENTIRAFGEFPKQCSQQKRIPLQASLSWFMTNLFCGTKKIERKPSHRPMQLGRKAYLPPPWGFCVQATSAFHLRGLHRQAPFDGREDLDEKNHRNPILMISVILSWYNLMYFQYDWGNNTDYYK